MDVKEELATRETLKQMGVMGRNEKFARDAFAKDSIGGVVVTLVEAVVLQSFSRGN